MVRCELLSNCIFSAVFDMKNFEISSDDRVVNCSQIVSLVRSLTWASNAAFAPRCCELLSNCIFSAVFDMVLTANIKFTEVYQRLLNKENHLLLRGGFSLFKYLAILKSIRAT